MNTYNMNQIAQMQPGALFEMLEDTEKCLLQIQEILTVQNGFQNQKANLQARCEQLRKKLKGLPYLPGVIATLVISFFWKAMILPFVGLLVYSLIYKKKKRPEWEAEISDIENRQIPASEAQIAQCDDALRQIAPWTDKAKAVLNLLPENLRSLESIRGLKDQFRQGAPNWYTAVQTYQSILREQERDRKIQNMEHNVNQMREASQQTAAAANRTASAAEDVKRSSRNIAKNTARTASAAESAAYSAERSARAAQESAKANKRAARAAERQAKASERTADAAESAADSAAYSADILRGYMDRW